MSIDYRDGEKLYKEFIKFRRTFMEEAFKNASFSAVSLKGERYRPVVMRTLREMQKVQEDVEKWQWFVAEFEKFPEMNVSAKLIKPLPTIIMGATSTTVYEYDAVATRTLDREFIISRITNLIKRAQKMESEDLLKRLNEEYKLFSALPAGDVLRRRSEGFKNVLCAINFPTEDGSTNLVSEKVSAHGIFICSQYFGKKSLQIGGQQDYNRASIYENIPAMTTLVYPTDKVYRVADIDAFLEQNKDWMESTKAERNRRAVAKHAAKRKGQKIDAERNELANADKQQND